MPNDFYIPFELLIIGACIKLNKPRISGTELFEYVRRNTFKVEYTQGENPFDKFIKYDEDNDMYDVTLPALPPYIQAILQSI